MESEFDPSINPICMEHADAVEATKICKRCNREYCPCFASKTEPRMCKDCMSDFSVTISTVTKVIETVSPKGEVLNRRVQNATHYNLNGNDWLFVQRSILELNDQELEDTIEYHKNIASVMLTEREHRRMERAHKLANTRIIIPKRETQYEKEERERKATEKAANGNSKKTSTKKKTKQDALLEALATLLNGGVDAAQLKTMLEKK